MAVTGFLSERMAAVSIPALRARSLETRLGVDGVTISFDREGTVVGPIDVVVEWAVRQPQDSAGGTTSIVTTEGELHGRPGELDDVRAGDLFVIDGQTAEIVEPIVTDRGVTRAPYRLMAGGR